MKQFKQVLTLTIIATFLVSCNSPERSVGFNDWSDDGKEYKFHLGTEASIDVVKEFDKLSEKKNYDGMNEIFSDTTVITYQNGQKASLQDFISMNVRRDSILEANDAKLNWDLLRAFSVDIAPAMFMLEILIKEIAPIPRQNMIEAWKSYMFSNSYII